jgi:hypothetical protein
MLKNRTLTSRGTLKKNKSTMSKTERRGSGRRRNKNDFKAKNHFGEYERCREPKEGTLKKDFEVNNYFDEGM